MRVSPWLSALTLGLASTMTLAQASPECSITNRWPFTLKMSPSSSAGIVRADLFGPAHRMLGRQLILNGKDEGRVPIISPELGYLVGKAQPTVRCAIDRTSILKMLMVVDVGAQLKIRSIYQGKNSVSVALYAFHEDYFAGRQDEGLVNQSFSIQLDDRAPYLLQLSAKPGQDVGVRFERVSTGSHRIRFGAMDPADHGFTTTWLWALDFIQPNELSER